MYSDQLNKIGYARVSTDDQNLDLQIDALNKAGCVRIFKDITSGTNRERNGLTAALDYLRPGDVLLVWKLDRLGRSLKHLIEIVTGLEGKGIGFCSLQETIDTTTNNGKLFFHLFGALAEFEKGIIYERTMSGLKAARARGRVGGRPKVMDKEKIIMAKALMDTNSIPVKEVCKRLKVCKATLYNYLKKEGNKVSV
jgi:DNA invertase Pin-like site-specific DNA recombinase